LAQSPFGQVAHTRHLLPGRRVSAERRYAARTQTLGECCTLFPIRLANLSSEESLIAGPVTLVGKLVRAVRKPGQEYVDDASLATFSGPVDKIDGSQVGDSSGLGGELTSDSVVLAPGAVILPIAIYK